MSVGAVPSTCRLVECNGVGTYVIYPMAVYTTLPTEAQVSLRGDYSALILTTHLRNYQNDFNELYVNVSQSIRQDYDCSTNISDGPLMRGDAGGTGAYNLKLGQNVTPMSDDYNLAVSEIIPPFLRIQAEVQNGNPEFAVYLTLCR